MSNTASHVTAELEASFIRIGERTVMHRNFHRSPLKITKTHELEVGRLSVTFMDCSPGLLSGDRYRIQLSLGREADVFAASQSFTRVHPAFPGEFGQLHQRLQLAEGAKLEYALEPTTLFAGAALRSTTEIVMAKGSELIFHDVLCPGRASREELFAYQEFSGKMNVEWCGELIYANHLRIRPQELAHASRGLWGAHTHFGTLLCFSERITESWVEQVHTQIARFPHGEQIRAGVSLTYKHGLAINVLAQHAWLITQLFSHISDYFRTN